MTRSLVALACAAILGCTSPEKAASPAPRKIRLTSGTPGGGFHPLGASIVTALGDDISVEHLESPGSVNNVLALQNGGADFGLAYADVAYVSFSGTLAGYPQRFDRLRGIAVLQLAPIHLVASAASGIREVPDLRGRRVGVGTSGSGTALTAALVLEAYGVDARLVKIEQLRYNDAAARLAAGTLDAMFVTGADPLESVRMATDAGARIVPLAGPAVDRLRNEYPFFRITVVRGGIYAGHRQPVRTIGVENLLVCRAALDETEVHDITARIFQSVHAIPQLQGIDLEQAPAVPIPLHEGAARFYRERELSR